MPRSVEEILKHADELAARFENYEPDPRDARQYAASWFPSSAMDRAAHSGHN
jgi:hypothetical protein